MMDDGFVYAYVGIQMNVLARLLGVFFVKLRCSGFKI